MTIGLMHLGQCERCDEMAVAASENGDLLCEDCLFEQTCEELFGDPEDGQ